MNENIGSSLISAGSSLVGGLVSSIFQKRAATTAFHRQKALMDYQNNIQQNNELTSSSRQLAGMKAAGLNSAAALGGGVPQAANVSQGSAPQADMSGVGQGISDAGQRWVQAKQTEQMIEQSQANIDLTRAKEEQIKQSTEFSRKFGEKEHELGIQKLQSEVELATERIKNQRLQNITEEEFSKVASQRAALMISQMQSSIDLTNSNVDINRVVEKLKNGELNWQDKIIMGNLKEQSSRIGLNSNTASLAAANVLTIKETLPFVADLKQAELEKFGKDIAVLTQKAANMKTEGEREEILREIDRVSLKWSDKEHQRAVQEATSRIVLNSAKTVESGTSSFKNVMDGLKPW